MVAASKPLARLAGYQRAKVSNLRVDSHHLTIDNSVDFCRPLGLSPVVVLAQAAERSD